MCVKDYLLLKSINKIDKPINEYRPMIEKKQQIE